jgi:hypothetical protein
MAELGSVDDKGSFPADTVQSNAGPKICKHLPVK